MSEQPTGTDEIPSAKIAPTPRLITKLPATDDNQEWTPEYVRQIVYAATGAQILDDVAKVVSDAHNAALAAERKETEIWKQGCTDRDKQLAAERDKVKALVDALERIAEKRVLVMDDQGETVADALSKVAADELAKVMKANALPPIKEFRGLFKKAKSKETK